MPLVRRGGGGGGGYPKIETGDAGKLLAVNTTEDGVEWAEVPKELPAITGGDSNKVLAVKADGSGVEWQTASSGGGVSLGLVIALS